MRRSQRPKSSQEVKKRRIAAAVAGTLDLGTEPKCVHFVQPVLVQVAVVDVVTL